MARTLIDALREVPDRRGRKGRQNALPAILSLSIAAVLSGLEFNLKVVERYQQVVIGVGARIAICGYELPLCFSPAEPSPARSLAL
jgi:hypothetical protein